MTAPLASRGACLAGFKVSCGAALGAMVLIVYAMIDTPERGDPSGPSIEQAGITDIVTLQYGIWLTLVSAVVGAVACALSARSFPSAPEGASTGSARRRGSRP